MNLIDTDILIDAARNKTEAIAFLRGLENSRQPMAISVITYLELVVGCRNKREQREAQKLPTRFNLLHINDFIVEILCPSINRTDDGGTRSRSHMAG